MKLIIFILLTFTTLIFNACGQQSNKVTTKTLSSNNYTNTVYNFQATIPENWKLYGQIMNDSLNNMAIADWGLPKVYSEIEKTEIENSISIRAYKKKDINSLEKLYEFEYLRIDPTETALEIDKSSPDSRLVYTTTSTGLKYKGKSYFVFKNGIGYIINFMATPGTYDINIKTFEEFYAKVKFL